MVRLFFFLSFSFSWTPYENEYERRAFTLHGWFTKNSRRKKPKINNKVYFGAVRARALHFFSSSFLGFICVDTYSIKIERSFGAQWLDSHAAISFVFTFMPMGLHVVPFVGPIACDLNTSTQIIAIIFCEYSREKTLFFVCLVCRLCSSSHVYITSRVFMRRDTFTFIIYMVFFSCVVLRWFQFGFGCCVLFVSFWA